MSYYRDGSDNWYADEETQQKKQELDEAVENMSEKEKQALQEDWQQGGWHNIG